MTDWRSLCAELVDMIDVGMHPDYIDNELFQRAITALDGPADPPTAAADLELQSCCAQISQCHIIPPFDRDLVAEYLYATRRPPSVSAASGTHPE